MRIKPAFRPVPDDVFNDLGMYRLVSDNALFPDLFPPRFKLRFYQAENLYVVGKKFYRYGENKLKGDKRNVYADKPLTAILSVSRYRTFCFFQIHHLGRS